MKRFSKMLSLPTWAGSFSQSGRETRNAKKPLKGFQGCDKNGLDESFKMSPHLICLSWHFNFHITTRHDPEAGHKRDIRCQLRHIKWGLILKLSMRPFSRHSPNPSEFFSISSLSAALWLHVIHVSRFSGKLSFEIELNPLMPPLFCSDFLFSGVS